MEKIINILGTHRFEIIVRVEISVRLLRAPLTSNKNTKRNERKTTTQTKHAKNQNVKFDRFKTSLSARLFAN